MVIRKIEESERKIKKRERKNKIFVVQMQKCEII